MAVRTSLLVIVAFGILVSGQGTARAAIIVNNSSFESGPINASPGYGPVSGWTVGGGAGNNAVSDPFANGTPIPDGSRVAFQQGSGTLSQSLTGFVPGKTYTLQYRYNERGIGGVAQTYGQLGGSTVAGPTNTVLTDRYLHAVSQPFTATSTSHTVTLGSNGISGDNTALFDQVIVTRAVPLITNFNFEVPALAANSFVYAPNGTSGVGWSFTSQAGVSRNGSGFQGGGVTAPEGNQISLLQQVSTMSQTISGFEVGVAYSLSFFEAARSGGTGNDLNVLLGGSPIYSNGNVTSNSFIDRTSSVFIATSTSYTLTFQTTNPLTGDRTTFVDDVRFNFVSDPPVAEANGAYVYSASTLSQLLSSAGSADPEGASIGYNWVADGNSFSTSANPTLGLAATGLTAPGQSSNVSLTVTDNYGQTGTDTATVSYANAAPNANAGGPLAFNASLASVTANATFSDPDYAANAVVPGFESVSVQWGFGSAATQSAPQPGNSGFENYALAPNAHEYGPNGQPGVVWSFSGGAGLSRDISGFQGGSGVPAPEGSQIAFIQGGGAVSQNVSGFTPGAGYSVGWYEASRGAGNSPPTSHDDLRVVVDGNVAGPLHVVSNPNYTAGSANFTATAATQSLSLEATGNLGGDVTTFVDYPRFALTSAAPNPVTFAQAVANGLTSTTASIPLNLTVTDRAGAQANSSTTLSYTNVAPSPSATAVGGAGYSITFNGSFSDADLAANSVASFFEKLTYEFDLAPAATAAEVGTGAGMFATGMTTGSQTTPGLLGITLNYNQLISLFGGEGVFDVYANVVDQAGSVHSFQFQAHVVPEPQTLIIWGTLAVGGFGFAAWRAQRRRARTDA